MPARRPLLLTLMLLWALPAATGLGQTPNLVYDGGFETIREVSVGTDDYVRRNLEAGTDLGPAGPIVQLPANLSQFCGCRRLRVVKGEPGREVHSGQHAIDLDGSFHVRGGGPARTGDVFKASYYAKGKGRVRLILSLHDEEKAFAGQVVPDFAAVDSAQWVPVEHILDTSRHPRLKRIGARLCAKGDVRIDDLKLVPVRAAGTALERVPVPLAFAHRAATPPVIDGHLREACWNGARRNGPFREIYDNSKVSEPLTFFKVAYDDTHVYFGIEAQEPEAEERTAPKAEHDTWPRGSTVEFFLDTNHDRTTYYQLAANIAGTRFDQVGKDKDWNTDWRVATHVTGGGWTMEVAVPFRDVEGGPPARGAPWGLNLCRNRKGDLARSSSWAHVGRAFHRPGLLNTLIFGTPQDWWHCEMALCRQLNAKIDARLARLPVPDADMVQNLARVRQRHRALAAPPPNLPPDTTAFMALHRQLQTLKSDYQALADESEMATALIKLGAN